ncbi:MAG: hypothetical protein QOE16_2366 [Microbacteriaceae bacterium]|nr:hypothetical protein [Microbacteriaceae bacterium]
MTTHSTAELIERALRNVDHANEKSKNTDYEGAINALSEAVRDLATAISAAEARVPEVAQQGLNDQLRGL